MVPSFPDKFNTETKELPRCKQQQKEIWQIFNWQMTVRNNSNNNNIKDRIKLPLFGFPYKQGNLKKSSCYKMAKILITIIILLCLPEKRPVSSHQYLSTIHKATFGENKCY